MILSDVVEKWNRRFHEDLEGGTERCPQSPSTRGRPLHLVRATSVNCWFVSLISFRLLICKEIVAKNEHDKPNLFRSFFNEVFCFKNPEDPEEVYGFSFSCDV